MRSKRELNNLAARAILHLENAIADLKKFRSRGGADANRMTSDILGEAHSAHSYIFQIWQGVREPIPTTEFVDDGGDAHVSIRRRTKRIESKMLALPPATPKQLTADAGGLFPLLTQGDGHAR